MTLGLETATEPAVVTHQQLGDHSHLAELAWTPPNIPLYSLERTYGERSVVQIDGVKIGGPEIVLMAGPCSLENPEQILECAVAAKEAGASVLRGGAFKPRTSPYSFQGLGEEGLKMQRIVADRLGMIVVTEATEESNAEIVAKYAQIIQIGARNSQSFGLLVKIAKEAKKLNRAILYKRGPSMTLQEWLWGAEYMLAAGCNKIILCERGSMVHGKIDFDDEGVRDIRKLTHLPIIGDPTHAAKRANDVPNLAIRAIKAGVDGLIIETHPRPTEALSDGPRALLPQTLIQVANNINNAAPQGRYFSIQAP